MNSLKNLFKVLCMPGPIAFGFFSLRYHLRGNPVARKVVEHINRKHGQGSVLHLHQKRPFSKGHSIWTKPALSTLRGIDFLLITEHGREDDGCRKKRRDPIWRDRNSDQIRPQIKEETTRLDTDYWEFSLNPILKNPQERISLLLRSCPQLQWNSWPGYHPCGCLWRPYQPTHGDSRTLQVPSMMPVKSHYPSKAKVEKKTENISQYP